MASSVLGAWDLRTAAAKLWELDESLRPGVDYRVDLQRGGQMRLSARPFFADVDASLFLDKSTRPTFHLFFTLLERLSRPAVQAGVLSADDEKANWAFIDAVCRTKCMHFTHDWLVANGKADASWHAFKAQLVQLWFSLSSGGSGTTAFERIFFGTPRSDGKVVDVHNWVQIYRLERAGVLDYSGYTPAQGYRGDYPDEDQQLLTIKFAWQAEDSPGTTSFIGTSPEFEFALYTMCFLNGQESNPVTLAGYEVEVSCRREPGQFGDEFTAAFPTLGQYLGGLPMQGGLGTNGGLSFTSNGAIVPPGSYDISPRGDFFAAGGSWPPRPVAPVQSQFALGQPPMWMDATAAVEQGIAAAPVDAREPAAQVVPQEARPPVDPQLSHPARNGQKNDAQQKTKSHQANTPSSDARGDAHISGQRRKTGAPASTASGAGGSDALIVSKAADPGNSKSRNSRRRQKQKQRDETDVQRNPHSGRTDAALDDTGSQNVSVVPSGTDPAPSDPVADSATPEDEKPPLPAVISPNGGVSGPSAEDERRSDSPPEVQAKTDWRAAHLAERLAAAQSQSTSGSVRERRSHRASKPVKQKKKKTPKRVHDEDIDAILEEISDDPAPLSGDVSLEDALAHTEALLQRYRKRGSSQQILAAQRRQEKLQRQIAQRDVALAERRKNNIYIGIVLCLFVALVVLVRVRDL